MPADEGMLTGTGLDLGPVYLRYRTRERTLLRVLRDRAAEHGDRRWLVIDSEHALSFGEAWRGACRVGNALDRDGLPRDAHVGLLLTNQIEFMPAFYGPQVRGGLTVPFNAELRGDPLQRQLEHSDARLLIVRADRLARLAELDGLHAVEMLHRLGLL